MDLCSLSISIFVLVSLYLLPILFVYILSACPKTKPIDHHMLLLYLSVLYIYIFTVTNPFFRCRRKRIKMGGIDSRKTNVLYDNLRRDPIRISMDNRAKQRRTRN
jgi:hypothetical protein